MNHSECILLTINLLKNKQNEKSVFYFSKKILGKRLTQ